MSRSDELRRLDAVLLELRRFLEAPGGGRGSSTVRHAEDRTEVSTVLVVDAIARSDATGACGIGTVAAGLHVAPSTASRLVERAVRAGMVDRARSDTDPRRAALTLTAAGRRLHRDAVHFRTSRLESMTVDWAPADLATLTRLLERFARSAGRPTEESP